MILLSNVRKTNARKTLRVRKVVAVTIALSRDPTNAMIAAAVATSAMIGMTATNATIVTAANDAMKAAAATTSRSPSS